MRMKLDLDNAGMIGHWITLAQEILAPQRDSIQLLSAGMRC